MTILVTLFPFLFVILLVTGMQIHSIGIILGVNYMRGM
jgi:hypothetical protein